MNSIMTIIILFTLCQGLVDFISPKVTMLGSDIVDIRRTLVVATHRTSVVF